MALTCIAPAASAAASDVAKADPREVFCGVWGTARQCAGEPLKPGLTVRAEPFEIGAEWLTLGPVSCQLKWFAMEHRDDEVFPGAFAQCGEDAVRDYCLRMSLASDGALTIRWDFPISNGPLRRCPKT